MRILSFYILSTLLVLTTDVIGQSEPINLAQIEKEMIAASKLARAHQVDNEHEKAVYYGLKALDLARKTNKSELLFIELTKLSGIESDAGFYDRSIKRLLEAEEIDTSSNTHKRLSWNYARLFIGMGAPRLALDRLVKYPNLQMGAVAKLYTELGMHDSAINCYRQFFELEPNGVHQNNNLGIAYAANNNLDSGLYYYHRALGFVKNDEDFMFGMINGNIGALYSKKNLYKEAAPHLKIDFDISENEKEYEIHINVGELLYRAYASIGENKLANAVLENMLSYKNRLGIESELAIARVELLHFKRTENVSAYELRFKSYEKVNNKYLKSIQDKVQSTAEALSGARIKQVETEKTVLNQKLIIEQNEKNRTQLKNGLAMLGLAFVSLIVLFFFWRYRAIQKRKELIKESQLDSAKQKQRILALQVKDEAKNVQALSLELMMKKDFSATLINQLKLIENVSKSDLNGIEIFIQNELDIKSTRAELEEQMGGLSSHFYSILNIKHPNLTEMDKKLAAMIVMNMSNKDIATSKGITPESVKISKNRLKQKLSLPTTTDLKGYLNEILNIS